MEDRRAHSRINQPPIKVIMSEIRTVQELLGHRDVKTTMEMQKVPGTIDCLSGSNSDRKEIVETGNGLRASFSAPRSCIIRTKKAAWYKRLSVEFYSGCGASRLTFISLVVRGLSVV